MNEAHVWTHVAYARLADLLHTHAGLVFGPNRCSELESTVARLAGGPAAVGAYAQRVAADPLELDRLLAAVTVGETYFFRDPGQFAFLESTVIPALESDRGRRARRAGGPLRVWSAGCATGEEPYSLAMLLARLGLGAGGDQAQVLGTDLSQAALAAARVGVYRPWSMRLPDSAPAQRYLNPAGSNFSVVDEIRRRVVFRHLNLAADDYGAIEPLTIDVDLILCRNVLIYLDASTTARIAKRLFGALAPGGWLLTAPSDPPLGDLAPFEMVVDDAGVFYRRPGAQSAPVRPVPRDVAVPARGLATKPRASKPAPASRRHPPAPMKMTPALPNAPARRDPELTAADHYLRGLRHAEVGELSQAIEAIRRALYLDRSLALAHLTLGSLLLALGDPKGARHAYRKALVRCLELPADAPLPLSDGATAGYVADIARRHLAFLPDEASLTP